MGWAGSPWEGRLVDGFVVGGAHRRVPLTAAFDHILAKCGYGGGDAAIGTHGPTHWDGGLGMLGGLRDAPVCNSFAVLLPRRGVIAGRTGLESCLTCERGGCACWGCPTSG